MDQHVKRSVQMERLKIKIIKNAMAVMRNVNYAMGQATQIANNVIFLNINY